MQPQNHFFSRYYHFNQDKNIIEYMHRFYTYNCTIYIEMLKQVNDWTLLFIRPDLQGMYSQII